MDVLRIVLSVLLIGLIAYFVPVEDFLKELGEVHPWPVVLSCLTVPLIVYLDANRTQVLTRIQGLSHSVGELCRISFASSFYSTLLPGLLAGGLLRWHRLARPDGKPVQALAVLVFGRALSTVLTVSVGLVCWSLDPVARAHPLWGAILLIVLLGLAALITVIFLSDRSAILARRFGARCEKLMASAAQFKQLRRAQLAQTILLMLTNELMTLGSVYLLASALDLPISVAGIGWVRAFVLLLTIVPISVLGIGVREGGLIAMLSLYHIDAATAVAFATLLLGRNLVAAVLGGCLELGQVAQGPLGRLVKPWQSAGRR